MNTAHPDDDTASNKAIAIKWACALFEGDVTVFRDLTHHDFESVMVGDMPMCQPRTRREFIAFMGRLRTEQFAPGPFTVAIGSVTAEADRVWLEAESKIPLRNGKLYNNFYLWGLTIRGGQVVRMVEAMDTLHVHRVLEGADVEGQIERVNQLFSTPTRVIEGVVAPVGD